MTVSLSATSESAPQLATGVSIVGRSRSGDHDLAGPSLTVRMSKRAVDLAGSVCGLILLAPLMLAVVLAVRIGSRGPAFFRQERVGLDGRPFRIWKFRTMTAGAEHQLAGLLERHGRDAVPLFKVPDDPRVTRIGRFLRRSSVDELPQLFNVLAGHMSLVGPRPQCAAEVALYTPEHRARLVVRPGMTGLWQVSGRSRLTWSQAIEYDLTYVRTCSLLLDLRLLARTIGAVLRGDGAV
jgi:lipopolysaccharide/colanic/teichoic acid biosynthesis glycosyltransferase